MTGEKSLQIISPDTGTIGGTADYRSEMPAEQHQVKKAGEPPGIFVVTGAAAGCAYKLFQFVIILHSTSNVTSFEFGDFLEFTSSQCF